MAQKILYIIHVCIIAHARAVLSTFSFRTLSLTPWLSAFKTLCCVCGEDQSRSSSFSFRVPANPASAVFVVEHSRAYLHIDARPARPDLLPKGKVSDICPLCLVGGLRHLSKRQYLHARPARTDILHGYLRER